MTLWLAIPLAILILVMVFVLSSSVNFRLRCYKKGKNDLIALDMSALYGLIKLHYELPQLIFKGLEQGVWGEFKETGTSTTGINAVKGEKYDKERMQKWRGNLQQAIQSTDGMMEWIKETIAHVQISKLDWSTDFSLGDAAGTATASGALWGLKWTIVGWISQHVKLKEHPRVFVKPVFQDDLCFSMELEAEGRLSVAIIIFALWRLLGRVLKENGGITKWKKLIKQMRSESLEKRV